MVLLSPEEKIYVVHGAEQDVRCDGRKRFQCRPVEIETDLIPTAMGSARVRIGTTDVIACVKANTITPPPEKPAEGELQLLVHFSCVADPENEGRASEQLRDQYTHVFNKLYSTVKLTEWCVLEKVKSWKFFVDVSVITLNGNLHDAVGLAVKSALATTVVPVVRPTNEDKGQIEFSISDDPSDVWTPNVEHIPLFVTAVKIGDAFMIDPTAQEEQCASLRCTIACTEAGKVLHTMKSGAGSICHATLVALVRSATSAGVKLNQELRQILASVKSRQEIVGYL